ncbi:hypothetical protein [Amycolatopsis taiwanensis]|uniref:Uncharacterized protein n=1 Tax=Amycolatopsis taiwanensis TaxID=342230 RepID=A0A9W6QVK2_9PSEU|nr:hypothetical protein [Amycolatopsis taiwanensis]GLY63735.1 hypothetical protein Atai01_03540 [Amycolatopsis taiwanensis]
MNDKVGQEGARVAGEVQPPTRPATLHRPWRLVTAGCELAVAAAAVWCAVWIWGFGVRTLTLTLSDGTSLTSTRLVGSWAAGAIALGMVAGILLVDAVREVLLGTGVRRRRRRRRRGATGAIEVQLPHLSGS